MSRWIVMLLLACAACAGKKRGIDATERVGQIAELLEDIVEDPARRTRALERYAAFERTAIDFFREMASATEDAQILNVDYDAPRTSFDAIRDRMRTARRRRSQQAIDHALAIREILTREEWFEFNTAIRKGPE